MSEEANKEGYRLAHTMMRVLDFEVHAKVMVVTVTGQR